MYQHRSNDSASLEKRGVVLTVLRGATAVAATAGERQLLPQLRGSDSCCRNCGVLAMRASLT
jgi:hypothetical protein